MSLDNKNLLFYDGECGLCHHTVKFALKHDKRGVFRFAPLGGETFKEVFKEEERESFPDSMVLIDENGRSLLRSSATAYLLKKLGGIWGLLGLLLWLIPKPLRNLGYIFIAKIRHLLFKKPDQVCPLMPANLMGRFLK